MVCFYVLNTALYIHILGNQIQAAHFPIRPSKSCLLSIERGRCCIPSGLLQTGLMALIKWKHLLGRSTESLSSLILQCQMVSSCCLFFIRLISDPSSHKLLILNTSIRNTHTDSHWTTCTSQNANVHRHTR